MYNEAASGWAIPLSVAMQCTHHGQRGWILCQCPILFAALIPRGYTPSAKRRLSPGYTSAEMHGVVYTQRRLTISLSCIYI